jgi:hypothetical protein
MPTLIGLGLAFSDLGGVMSSRPFLYSEATAGTAVANTSSGYERISPVMTVHDIEQTIGASFSAIAFPTRVMTDPHVRRSAT